MTNWQVLRHYVRVVIGVELEALLIGQTEVIVHDQASDLHRKLVSQVGLNPGTPQHCFSEVGHLVADSPWMVDRVAPCWVA